MVSVGNGPCVHVREITPKDLYYAQILRQEEKSFLLLVERMILNPETLEELNPTGFDALVKWITENLLDEKVLPVENWLELAFHLCKQRWDSSIDWLETQPMSKVMLMVDILKKFNEQQDDAAKKAARKRK